MNFVLRRAGGKGTHSRAARSFLEYGKKLDGPRVGAIAILYRKGPNNGHVGVVRGTDGQGNPIIVSGNHGNAVRAVGLPEEQGARLCDAAAIRARRHGGGRARRARAASSRQRALRLSRSYAPSAPMSRRQVMLNRLARKRRAPD